MVPNTSYTNHKYSVDIGSTIEFGPFLLSKIHSFQNGMKEQINQSIVHRWLRLFSISQAIFEFHLEKMYRILRRSIFWKRTELICTPNKISFSYNQR